MKEKVSVWLFVTPWTILYSQRNSSGQNTGVGRLFLLQGIFPTPGGRPQVSGIAGRYFIYLFFPFIFISWRLITLQYCSGFCHGFTCLTHPHPDPPSPLPPPSSPHPSGSSQCTSPEHLSHASNLGRWSFSPLIVYLFQCYSLRTSHPRLRPQSLASRYFK